MHLIVSHHNWTNPHNSMHCKIWKCILWLWFYSFFAYLKIISLPWVKVDLKTGEIWHINQPSMIIKRVAIKIIGQVEYIFTMIFKGVIYWSRRLTCPTLAMTYTQKVSNFQQNQLEKPFWKDSSLTSYLTMVCFVVHQILLLTQCGKGWTLRFLKVPPSLTGTVYMTFLHVWSLETPKVLLF